MYATRKKAFWPLLFLVVTAGGVGKAQEYKDGFAENNTLSLAEVIHYAQEHNPAIQTARERLRAAQQVPAQAAAYEDPIVKWEKLTAPANLRIDQADTDIFRL